MHERNLKDTSMYTNNKANRKARKQIAIMHTIKEPRAQTKSTKVRKVGRKP